MMEAFKTAWVGRLKYLALVWMMLFKDGNAMFSSLRRFFSRSDTKRTDDTYLAYTDDTSDEPTTCAVAFKRTVNGLMWFRCVINPTKHTMSVYYYGSRERMLANGSKPSHTLEQVAKVYLSAAAFVRIPGIDERKPILTVQLVPADVKVIPVRPMGRFGEYLYDSRRLNFNLNFRLKDKSFTETMRAQCAAHTRECDITLAFKRLGKLRTTLEFYTFNPVTDQLGETVVIESNNRAWNKAHHMRMNASKPKPQSEDSESQPDDQKSESEEVAEPVDDVGAETSVDSESRIQCHRKRREVIEMEEIQREQRDREARERIERHREAEQASRNRFFKEMAARTPKIRKRDPSPTPSRWKPKFLKPSGVKTFVALELGTALFGAATTGIVL